jgi:NAD(P)-dependent dehydrogenase (short-subunit alcohol dehydrogenase family)
MGETAAKVALITGANRGIGLETARQLGKLGMRIVVGSRDLARGEAAAEVLRGVGVDARAIKLDVVKRADRVAAARFIKKEFGRLDVLINNAAVMLDPRTANATSSTPAKILHDTFETNFFAVVALTQTLLPLLRKSPAGRIVNLCDGRQ